MAESDDVLKNVFSDANYERKRKEADALFEEKLLSKILTELKVTNYITPRRNSLRNFHNDPDARVTFEWFFNDFNDFPIWLKIKRIPYVHKLGFGDLLSKFTKTKLYKAWEDAQEESFIENIGLVFSCVGVKNKHLILHNVNTDAFSDSKIIIKMNKQILCIERLSSIIPWIDERWFHRPTQ